jgi:hypothetical protein
MTRKASSTCSGPLKPLLIQFISLGYKFEQQHRMTRNMSFPYKRSEPERTEEEAAMELCSADREGAREKEEKDQ